MEFVKLAALVTLVLLTFGAGLRVKRDDLLPVFKNRPLLLKAFLANFIIVPLLGWSLVRLFQVPTNFAIGILLMAMSPGVPFVMIGASKKGGSLEFAVALAFLMPLLSIITIPITAELLLPQDPTQGLPFRQFLTTLVFYQLLPLIAGVIVAARAPAFAERIFRPLFFVFVAALLVVLAALAPRMAAAVSNIFGSRALLTIACLVLLSFVSGWLLGGPELRHRRTLGLGTILRNIGLCISLATVAFPDRGVAVAVMTYLLVQIIVSLTIGSIFSRTAKAEGVT